jgi:hypothetical protein
MGNDNPAFPTPIRHFVSATARAARGLLPAMQQTQQLSEVYCHPPRLVLGEQLGR